MMFCSWYRWKISRAIDENKPLTESIGRHVQQCVHCREYLHRMNAVGERLVRDAGEWRVALEGDARGFSSPAEGGLVLFRINWSLAAAAAVVMGVGLVSYLMLNPTVKEDVRVAETGVEPPVNVAMQPPDVGEMVSSSAMVVSGLLNDQTQMLVMDTRRAANFLLDQVPMSDRLLAMDRPGTTP